MTILEVLQQARDYIADGTHWIKYEYNYGYGVCAVGSIDRAVGLDIYASEEILDLHMITIHYIDDITREFYNKNIVWVNDNIGHEAVMRCFDEAILRLSKEMAYDNSSSTLAPQCESLLPHHQDQEGGKEGTEESSQGVLQYSH